MQNLYNVLYRRAPRRSIVTFAVTALAVLLVLLTPGGGAAMLDPLPAPRAAASPATDPTVPPSGGDALPITTGTTVASPVNITPPRRTASSGTASVPTGTPSATPVPAPRRPASTGTASVSTGTPSATPTPPARPSSSVALGVYIPGAAQNMATLDTFETMTGKQIGIVHWFQPWGYDNGTYTSVLDAAALQTVAAHGKTPLITWEAWGTVNGKDPSHVANIPTGAFDDYIDTWARGLKDFGQPVYLRLFHEMNFQGYSWAVGVNGNTATDLAVAWRYVHDRFVRAGATNVQWVWCPNPQNGLVAYRAIYPGDAYVDSFGIDIYNGGTQFDWGGWVMPEQALAASYAEFQTLNATKPLMITEVSSVEVGGSKANWITALYKSAPSLYPNLRAIVWFHDDWTVKGQNDPRNLPAADWRVNTSPTSLQAFRAL